MRSFLALVACLLSAASAAGHHADVPGIVIDTLDAKTGQYVGSPSLAVLPDGRYVASHDVFGPGSTFSRTRVFRSADRGRTWQHLTDLQGQFWSGLFVHRSALYIMGTSKRYGFVVIRRSTDGGAAWTEPRDAKTGRLTDQAIYHTAPMPVVVHKGRVWRTMEERAPKGPKSFGALVMSAPADADLLDAGRWTLSNRVFYDPAWREGVRHWREGNVVVAPDGKLLNIIRTDPRPEIAAILRLSDDGTALTFDPKSDFIHFIGGAVKFTIRFDPKTRRYWTLGSKQTDPLATRNVLVMTSSADLRTWRLESYLLVHPDRSHHAFQYIDWLFDGDDVIAASRTAWHGSHNFHDANYLTFHRVPGFRDRSLDDPPLSGAAPEVIRRAPHEHLVAAWDFEEGRGGPLADKARRGTCRDTLRVVGGASVRHGKALIPRDPSALLADDSADLSPAGELTIWLRLRVEREPRKFISLVDKRRFRDPEDRSYGLFITPDAGQERAFGLGGQVSATGVAGGAITVTEGREIVPTGEWVHVAMVVRREGWHLSAEWLACLGEAARDASKWQRANGPARGAQVTGIHRARQPLRIGNNVHLRLKECDLEFDEVRLYDRALTVEELAAIVPGEL